MRLIDADRNWEEAECEDNGYKLEYYQGIFAVYDKNGSCICEFMPDLPTAYDIDKVVEEFEKATQYIKIDGKPTSVKAIHPAQAIEIVKQGCVSDDVCEWIKYDYRTMCPKNHDVKNPYWRIPMDMDKLKYCPYCGKKIKVVE